MGREWKARIKATPGYPPGSGISLELEITRLFFQTYLTGRKTLQSTSARKPTVLLPSRLCRPKA